MDVGLMLIFLLLAMVFTIVAYACCVISGNSDKEQEEMFKNNK